MQYRISPDDYTMIGRKLALRVLLAGPDGSTTKALEREQVAALRYHEADRLDRTGHTKPWKRDLAADALADAHTNHDRWFALHWWWTEAQPERLP